MLDARACDNQPLGPEELTFQRTIAVAAESPASSDHAMVGKSGKGGLSQNIADRPGSAFVTRERSHCAVGRHATNRHASDDAQHAAGERILTGRPRL